MVHPDLAEVLKNYTKEVIRRQPEDLLQFSALYFANLASIAPPALAPAPVTLDQITALYRSMSQQTCNVRSFSASACG